VLFYDKVFASYFLSTEINKLSDATLSTHEVQEENLCYWHFMLPSARYNCHVTLCDPIKFLHRYHCSDWLPKKRVQVELHCSFIYLQLYTWSNKEKEASSISWELRVGREKERDGCRACSNLSL
jgi:hypothetical protein